MDAKEMVREIAKSDKFLEMETIDQLLFFHLAFRMNSNGTINNPKSICRMVGIDYSNIETLIDKGFLIRNLFGLSVRDIFSSLGSPTKESEA